MSSQHLPRVISIVCLIATVLVVGDTTQAAPADLIRATKTLHAFQLPPNRPNSLVRGSDGNFYGATGGGVFGFLFKVTPAGAFSILHDFKDDEAGNPVSLTLGKDGNLYGILSSNGAIFKCSQSGTLSVLYNPGAAAYPAKVLQGSDGNLYGTTRSGGAANQGSIFRLGPSGQFTTIYSFTGGSDGSAPYELIEGGPGIFYGTSGGYLPSAVFKVTSAGVFNVVHDFKETSESDFGHLVYGSDGNLYGSEFHSSGAQSAYYLFRLTPNGDFTQLYNFGGHLYAITLGNDDNLYCSTSYSLFRATLGGQVTRLYTFTATNEDGYQPTALTYVANQGLYGVNWFGSVFDVGTVFHLDPSNQLTTLVRFGSLAKGYYPKPVFQASDGSFFGTTDLGGSAGYGTVYHLKSSGEFSYLARV